MNARTRRCYIVHNKRGKVLAIAPVTTGPMREGVELGWRPVPGPNQVVSEVELDEECARLAPHELLEFEIKLDEQTGRAQLRRPSKPLRG